MFIVNNTGNIDVQFLNNRGETPALGSLTSTIMIVMYRELQEYDVFKWNVSVYDPYTDSGGIGVTVDKYGDLHLHLEGDATEWDFDSANAQVAAIAAYGANWDMADYRDNEISDVGAATDAHLWELVFKFFFDEPLPHTATGLSPHDHVRRDGYAMHQIIKPWLGLGGTKGEEHDPNKHASALITGLIHPKVVTGELAQDGHTYMVDSTSGTVTLTVDEFVNSITIRDWGSTWTDTNKAIVNIGTDTLEFGLAGQGNVYNILREGTTFRAYGSDGTIIVGNV